LSDPSTAELIVRRSDVCEDDTVLEIGPGLGALTIPLAKRAGRVVAVEKDRDIVPLLRNEVLAHGLSNVEIVDTDILRVDLRTFRGDSERKLVVMGNLPYNISSQVLVNLVHSRDAVSRAIFMFQKELAERLVANPGCKAYGRISVMLQYCADISSIADVKASQFYPRPKVDSEVIDIRFRSKPTVVASDERFLFRVIKAAFGQRRKTLRNSLAGSGLRIDAAAAQVAIEEAGIDPVRRAETLTVEEFVSLAEGLMRVCGEG